MKMLLTVVIGLALYANRPVVADDHCTQYHYRPYIPGYNCKDIYIMNPESREIPGYYWILSSPTNVYCGMSYTGQSCEDIYYNNPETGDKNGYYPINDTKWTYCDMTAIADASIISSCAGVKGNWSKIADIDIGAGDDCPFGWSKSSYGGVSFCKAPSNDTGCYSTKFSTNGVSYQQVCGRAKGYQKGSPNAFYPFVHKAPITIESYYVDGLSITHGTPRQHIWTYAAGITGSGTSITNCPCAASGGTAPPSFVGSNYYCESGAESTYDFNTYYLSDPLWDGAGCPVGNDCCSNPALPWFYRQLSGTTHDDVEVRICRDEGFERDGILIDILELYIQ